MKNVVKKVVEKSCWKLKCCQESSWIPWLQNTGKPVFGALKHSYSCKRARWPAPFLVSTIFFTTLLLSKMLSKIVVKKPSMLLKNVVKNENVVKKNVVEKIESCQESWKMLLKMLSKNVVRK